MVKYFLRKYHPSPGHILDPFAGVGSTLFAARELGWETTGIELLPVGVFSFQARMASELINSNDFKKEIFRFKSDFQLGQNNVPHRINHISITKGAFPDETEKYLNYFLDYCNSINDSVDLISILSKAPQHIG